MDIEQKQAELIEHFVEQASNLRGGSLPSLIVEATSHPSLFAFSEILSVPNVVEMQETEYSVYLDLLRLFAHGTWSDYKSNAACFPPLAPDQVRKLKQLSVLTLAETKKVLPYDQLIQELDVSNVRELEDFLINECMYAGIVRGKLDQLRRCFEVQFAAGRDLRPGQLNNMIQTLTAWYDSYPRLDAIYMLTIHDIWLVFVPQLGQDGPKHAIYVYHDWLTTSDGLLLSIQEKIKWADKTGEAYKKHRKEVEDKVDEVKKTLKADVELRGHEEISYSEPGGVMDYEEDRGRPKRRRQPT